MNTRPARPSALHTCPIPDRSEASMYSDPITNALTWGDRGDSNPRPSGPQPDALTT
jgi:hypothetical protein